MHMLRYTVKFISFPDDYGNTLKHRVEIRCVYWKQHDTCFRRSSTAKTKLKGNRPTSCLGAVISFLTCSSVSFQRRVGLDFCEIYLAETMQEVGKEGRMRIRPCLQNNSHFPPHTPHSNISVAEGHADNCNNIICCVSRTWLLWGGRW